MRQLSVQELQFVNGGSFLGDVGSVFKSGVTSKEFNLVAAAAGVSMIIGGALHGTGIVIGTLGLVGYALVEMYLTSK